MNYAFAKFKWYHPTKKPRAILVLLPGSNGDGRDLVEARDFKAFADHENVSLLGCFYQDVDPSSIEGYTEVKKGSGQALLEEIELESRRVKVSILNAPLLLWGYSAGGQFSYEMACYVPGRVIGFIVNKGGYYYTALAPEDTREIPSIWYYGKYDEQFRIAGITGIFAMNQRAGAKNWELVADPTTHDIGSSIWRSLDFYRKILADREE